MTESTGKDFLDQPPFPRNTDDAVSEGGKTNIEQWLSQISPEEEKKGWKAIGTEVRLRKTLLLASAMDLKERGIPNALALAATDVFVEKAQRLLEERAVKFMNRGAWCAGGAITVTITAGILILRSDPKSAIELINGNNVNASIYLFKMASAGAFLGGGILFLSSLSKAFFHEAMIHYGRRHALRFGRLFVYLKNGKVNYGDLRKAFQWNAEFKSAFNSMQTEKMHRGPLQIISEAPVKVIEALGGKGRRKSAAEPHP